MGGKITDMDQRSTLWFEADLGCVAPGKVLSKWKNLNAFENAGAGRHWTAEGEPQRGVECGVRTCSQPQNREAREGRVRFQGANCPPHYAGGWRLSQIYL